MSLTVERTTRRQALEATCLAVLAGFIDAYGLITYRTYLSLMSGNTTQAGSAVGRGEFAAIVPPAIAVLSFVAGCFVGTLIAHSAVECARRIILASVAVALAVVIGLTIGGLPSVLLIAIVSFEMGAMNIAFSRIGTQTVNITFVTGTLNSLGAHLALAFKKVPLKNSDGPYDTHVRRALFLDGLWVGFFFGTILSGIATRRFGVWVLLFPILVLSSIVRFES